MADYAVGTAAGDFGRLCSLVGVDMFGATHFRLLMVVIALVLAGALAWRIRATPPAPAIATRNGDFSGIVSPPTVSELSRERRLVEERLDTAPEFADFIARLRTSFPADWNRMLEAFTRRDLARGDLEAPEAYLADILRQLRRDRGVVAGRASAGTLTRIFDLQAQMIAALAKADKRLCVDFLLGQSSPAFVGAMSRDRTLLAGIAGATLDAIIEGGGAGAVERAAPNDEDFSRIEMELRARGLGDAEITALLDGRLSDPPLPDQQLCDAGVIYFEALKELPEDARIRIYAFAARAMGRA